jgi:glycosyltransferase involved in cell wall biosynthesis
MSGSLSILLAGDYPPDPMLGSSKVFYKLRDEFLALGHSCDVIFGDAIRAPRGRRVRHLVAPLVMHRVLARACTKKRYDVVDVASAEGLWFGRANRARRRTAYVCRSNGLEHLNYRQMIDDHRAGVASKPWYTRIWYPATRLSQVAAAARVSDRLLLLNETDRQFAIARRWKPAGRIDVVAHGVSDAFFADAQMTERGRGLLFCGTWTPMKGIADLVGAFERINDGGARVPLTILGPAVDSAAVIQAFPERLRGLVTVIPRASEADVITAFRRFDVLLWPSTYEGFGLVLLEAMSQGMAVVATPAGCAPSVVRDGENALAVQPRNPSALAAAATRLLDDVRLRERLGEAARTSVAGMTWRRTAEQTLEAYRRAIADAA